MYYYLPILKDLLYFLKRKIIQPNNKNILNILILLLL